MSKHVAGTAAAVISPKVKATGVGGAAVVALLVVASAFLDAVPAEALAALGPWAAPVGAAVATLAAVLAAYAKTDTLRNLGGAIADLGDTYTPAPVEPAADASLPDPAVVDGTPAEEYATPAADALAAKADAIRQGRAR